MPKKSQEPKKILKEFRLENTEELKPGTEINLDVLKDKKYVDVRAKLSVKVLLDQCEKA